MWAYLRDPIGCLLPFSRRYGDVFTFPGSPSMVCVGSPAAIQAVYGAPDGSFEPFNVEMGDLIGKHALLLQKGAEHRRARKLMSPPFQGARMRTYGDLMVRAAERRSDEWRPGQTVSLMATAQQISLDVILEAVFGVGDPAGQAELGRLLLDITDGISPLVALFPSLRRQFGGLGPWASFTRKRARLWAAIDQLVQARRAQSEPGTDVLGLLVAARYDDGAPMSDEELRDQLVLLMFAGHETTAISIAWAMHALHQPASAAVLERLRAELATVPTDSSDATPDALAKLPYLDAVCNETLRRYPLAPAPNPRRLLRDMKIDGHALPAGTGVTIGIGMVHFREELYPEPLRFRPERFLERQYSPFEFVPFGGGARRCLGASMAGHEMRLVIATLLRRFRLRLASSREDPGAVRAANVGPKHGVKMVVEERLVGAA